MEQKHELEDGKNTKAAAAHWQQAVVTRFSKQLLTKLLELYKTYVDKGKKSCCSYLLQLVAREAHLQGGYLSMYKEANMRLQPGVWFPSRYTRLFLRS